MATDVDLRKIEKTARKNEFDIKDIKNWLSCSGLTYFPKYGGTLYSVNKKVRYVSVIEKKLDMLIEHLGLEYIPEEKVGPCIKKKKIAKKKK